LQSVIGNRRFASRWLFWMDEGGFIFGMLGSFEMRCRS
jgi:hypothetical protein